MTHSKPKRPARRVREYAWAIVSERGPLFVNGDSKCLHWHIFGERSWALQRREPGQVVRRVVITEAPARAGARRRSR